MSEQLTRSSKHIQKALKKQKAYKRATAVAGTSMILAPVGWCCGTCPSRIKPASIY